MSRRKRSAPRELSLVQRRERAWLDREAQTEVARTTRHLPNARRALKRGRTR